jgi:hypothetical protein
VARLAGWSGFSATIIVSGVDNPETAANLYRSCGILMERCRTVQENSRRVIRSLLVPSTSRGHLKRLSRIKRRAIAEVQEAFSAGQISAHRADTLLYLPPEEQRAQLNALLAEQADIARRSRIAAQVIKAHIDSGRRNLMALREDLRIALCSPPTSGIAEAD